VDVVVRLPGVLAADAGGRRVVQVSMPADATVRQVFDALAADHPRLDFRIRDETGAVRRYVNVYLGEQDIRAGRGLDTPVAEGDTIMVVPSVAGG
jgi:sulfur-carrier protein